jgi:hypothetical protein
MIKPHKYAALKSRKGIHGLHLIKEEHFIYANKIKEHKKQTYPKIILGAFILLFFLILIFLIL